MEARTRGERSTPAIVVDGGRKAARYIAHQAVTLRLLGRIVRAFARGDDDQVERLEKESERHAESGRRLTADYGFEVCGTG